MNVTVRTLLSGLVICVLGPACSTRSKTTPSRKTGPLSAKTIQWIESRNAKALSSGDSKRLRQLTWKACRTWAELKQNLQRALRRQALDQEDEVILHMWLEKVCPQVRPKLIDKGIRVESRAWYSAVWKVCGFGRLGVVSDKEAAGQRGLAILLSLLHNRLIQCGAKDRTARILSRAWWGPHPLLQGRLQGATLAKGDVLRRLTAVPVVTQSSRGTFLNGTKTGDPSKQLHKARKVALIADHRAKFATVAPVVRALSTAEVHELHLVVRGRDDEPAVIPVDLRPPATAGKIESLDLTLTVTAQGLELASRHGPECSADTPEKERVCFKRQGNALPLNKLRLHLWHLFAAKYKDPSNFANPKERHTLRVAFAGDVAWADAIAVIQAVREIPRGATRPPAPKNFPPGGCARSFDRRTGKWRYLERQGESIRELACMYDHVRLVTAP